MPRLSSLAVLVNPDNPVLQVVLKLMGETAKGLKVELHQFPVRSPSEFDAAFAAMAKQKIGAVAFLEDAMFNANAGALVALAAKHRLPATGGREFADAGGLLGYGVNFPEIFRRAAYFIDRILGTAYAEAYCPKLYALANLRTLIVKRPAITTAEVLAGPVRGQRRTHLVTGYVHKPYSRVYALLARHAGFDSALIVRGVEGGVIPGLSQAGKAWRVLGDAAEVPVELKPAEMGIESAVRAPPTCK